MTKQGAGRNTRCSLAICSPQELFRRAPSGPASDVLGCVDCRRTMEASVITRSYKNPSLRVEIRFVSSTCFHLFGLETLEFH